MIERVYEACRLLDAPEALDRLNLVLWVQNLGPWTEATALYWAAAAGRSLEIVGRGHEASLAMLANQVFWSVWPMRSTRTIAGRSFLKCWWADLGVITETRCNVLLASELSKALPCGLPRSVFIGPNQSLLPPLGHLLGQAFHTNDTVLWDALVLHHLPEVTALLVNRSAARLILSTPATTLISNHRSIALHIMGPERPWNAAKYLNKVRDISSFDVSDTGNSHESVVPALSPLFQIIHLILVRQDYEAWGALVNLYPDGAAPFWPLAVADVVYSGIGGADRRAEAERWLRRPDSFWQHIDPACLARRLLDANRFYYVFSVCPVDSVELIKECVDRLPAPAARALARQEMIAQILLPEETHQFRRIQANPTVTAPEFAKSLLDAAAGDVEAIAVAQPAWLPPVPVSFSPPLAPAVPVAIAETAPVSLRNLPTHVCPAWLHFLFHAPVGHSFASLALWATPLSDHWVLERILLAGVSSADANKPTPTRRTL